MISRTLAVALLAGGCLTAAGGGAYLAVRHNGIESRPASTAVPVEMPDAAGPVSDTEATIDGNGESEPALPAPVFEPPSAPAFQAPTPRPAPASRREPARNASAPAPPEPVAVPAPVTVAVNEPAGEAADPAWPPQAPSEPVRPSEPPPASAEPRFVEVVIPASAVIGLQVDTPLSSERNEVEDRVEARVTRDVIAEGRLAIPAGSRVLGTVTMVERGGKMKERARLGVRFHTVVLAGGLHVPVRTETIVREGEPPAGESARKIGGAAAGGAILGAILGGGKGAAIGGAAGAGAGTAVVMAGDRNAATLPAGTAVTARLSAPVVLELEGR
jgi:hypothetical protein